MTDPTLNIKIAGDLTAIKSALSSLTAEFQKVGAAATAAGKQAGDGLTQAERAAKSENEAAKRLVATLQQQAEAYGLTGSKLLALNKQRDLAKVKTDAERKAVSAAYDTMINKARAAEAAQLKAAGGMGNAMRSIQRAVVGLATSFIALQAIRITIGFGDQFAQLNGVLKLATKSTEEFTRAQQGVLKIANDTRAPVKETADTYAALERTTRSVGLSQGELLTALETVNKSIALTPVSAQAAQAALVQFGQALGGNFKNGAQELNSILEQTPGLAISIAKGLGVEVTALKKMGEEGKLNTELVVRGLIRIRDQVDKDFQQVPKTISGVLQTIRNDLLVAIGSAGMAPLVEALEDLRRVVTDPAVVGGLTAIAAAIVKISSAAVGLISGTANVTKFIGESIAAFVNGVNPDDLVRLSEKIADLQEKVADFESRGDDIFGFNKKKVAEFRAELEKVQAVYDAARKAAEAAQIASEGSNKIEAEKAAKAAADAEKKFKEAQTKLTANSSAKIALDQNVALLKDTADRAIRELERLYETGKIKSADFFNAKRKATIDAINAEIEAAQFDARTAEKDEEKQKALTKIILLERQRNDVVKQTAIDRAEAARQEALALQDIEDRIAAAQGDSLAPRRRQLEREREELLKKFASDPGASVLINRLFDVETAKSRADQIEQEADRLLKRLQQEEASVSQQVTAGILSQETGEKLLRSSRQETIDQLIAMRDALQSVYDVAPSDDVLDKIIEFNRQIGEIGVRNATGLEKAIMELRNALASIKENFTGDAISTVTDSLANLFESIANGSKSAKDAVKDFVRSFAAAMLQIAARALATYVVLSLLDAIYPGLGKLTAASFSGFQGQAVQAGVSHTGGVAGQGGTIRMVNPALFARAPRYHMGGVAGLAPNEVPAILQRGEEVLAKGDPRNVMNGGGQAQADKRPRVINVFDKEFVTDQMDSAEGESVTMNHIARNPNKVRGLLGF